MDNNKKSLVYGAVGIALSAISWLIFGFLSFVGVGLGAGSLFYYSKAKKEENSQNLGGLICGILAIVIGGIAAVFYIIGLINLNK